MLATLPCVAGSEAEIFDKGSESADAGFIDVDLHIDAMDCDSWSVCTVRASGRYKGRSVAIDALIQSQGRQGRITFRSVGAASDAFAQALATLYKLPRDGARFASAVSAVSADIIFLDAKASTMMGKVFFAADGPESNYAELYTNIDKQRRILAIHEKDPEYRKNVLRALCR